MGQGRTFVGFGFGPIQSGLFLYEAFASGRFDRFVVAEVDQALVNAVRRAGGRYTINIAHHDRIEQATVGPIDIRNPNDAEDRAALVDAIAQSSEMATALPSVRIYDLGGTSSAAGMISDGLARGEADEPRIIYAAENHNHAAERLREQIERMGASRACANLQCLNTVIGKMSGVVSDAGMMSTLGLAPMTPDGDRAVLVEQFNHILISRISLPDYERGIDVFVEKDDLLPFEEAKLYGHNAIHAMIGYLLKLRGGETMDEAVGHDDLMAAARRAFLDESGAALCRKYAHLNDELFTAAGYEAYADDLLKRMVNPHLHDLVSRVTRDPLRKLGWEDRLYGTMRLALDAGIEPQNLALGAAAAVHCMIGDTMPAGWDRPVPTPEATDRDTLASLLRAVWDKAADDKADALIDLTWAAWESPR